MQNRLKILAVVLSLTILLSSFSVVWAASDNGKHSNFITAIEVKGNKKISNEEILKVVKTSIGDQISNQKLQKDLQAIFDLGYFFDVQASFENYKNGVKLIFEVVENPILKKIKIKGNQAISAGKIKEQLKLKTDKMLNTNQLNKNLRKVESYYQEEGYMLAKIEDILMKKDGTLVVTISEGKLAEIKIEGNEKTKDFVIKRKLTMEPGDVFNVKEMKQDLRDIYNLGFFKDIKPKLEKNSTNENSVSLTIEVKERKTGNFGIGAGYSSTDGWLGHIEVQEKNFKGRAQKLGFRWEFGEENTTYELSFFEPWAFGSDTSFGFSIYDRTDEKTGDFSEYAQGSNNEALDYEEQEKGGSITLGHPLGYDIEGYLKYEYDDTSLDGENIPSAALEELEGNTRSLTFSTVRDTRNDVFNPTDGRQDRLSIEYAGQQLGGDTDFTKYQLDLRDYTPAYFFEDNSWAFRFKTGLSDSGLPVNEEYELGGAQTVRGYKDGQFNGDDMILFNAEYRIPIADKFTGVLFTDAGKVWEEGENFNLDNLKKSAGLGVRVSTPVGQIRLDYGFQEEDSRLHFSLGQSF
ncbi:BamA/OMP85 family outer membrane protein [Selenihalanaerobacter shriftii]|uniref:Beta-barrel assembly machine subunit BamA n=1 Tax=Selenihalanaerobacter shriftii TaxID=142842 RepID=A0A1T4KYU3_9FIRM|nr:BamA/TamA family outer membrane protein [Selenihalanaerobacter shriftii]SJZ47634.1 Beta-barrel assembly machine subunit BamA [Selenihalanaerobacter shriftii]